MKPVLCAVALCVGLIAGVAHGEDGYDLWLRYRPADSTHEVQYRDAARILVGTDTSAVTATAGRELARGLSGLTGRPVAMVQSVDRDGAVVFGVAREPRIAALKLPVQGLGSDGFLIKSGIVNGHKATVIVGGGETGVLYGVFRFLRLMQTGRSVDGLDIREVPKVSVRILDHWDNLDRTVERGYAGFSIWDWQKLPGYVDPRYVEYARANASIGINAVVLNNVNAQAEILTPYYLAKVAALADFFRPYGIRVYLTAKFSAPIAIGGLKTADPADPTVRAWWAAKVDEIYRYVPDFGGFLVKANSEGQPGPQDYGRTHADGANMLADALSPHGGIVMWRAFVYASDPKVDRVKQAYNEFVPLDGAFRSNVVVQVKNGPLDFQPREPISPLFGAMKKTSLALEVQITKEYLGFATHLVYLGPLWQEVLQTDTFAAGKGTTVAKVVEDSPNGGGPTIIAGVANIGTDRDWTGSIFNQANWYAFGRLAWDPQADARAIAADWAAMTFTPNPEFVGPTVGIMMASREAAVNYMTPLGLSHQMGTGHHYGPAPWVRDAGRADWNPVYFHRADAHGIGVERARAGSDAAGQYAPALAALYEDVDRTPQNLLLWFHHVSWDRKMKTGKTVWAELVTHYDAGVTEVRRMRAAWQAQKPYVDTPRFEQTAAFLKVQEEEAVWWRDASIAYFQSVSGRPLPSGSLPPAHPLGYYESLRFPYAPGMAH